MKNSDQAAALAIADQIEASLVNGEPNAEQTAIEFIESAIDQPNGAMFVLQGIKAMLVFMQSPLPPKTADPMFAAFSVMNQNCSDLQRDAYNEYRSQLYCTASELRDEVRRLAFLADRDVPELVNDVVKLASQMPTLFDS